MEATNHLLLVGAGLLSGAILLGVLSARLGFPLLLVFLFVGMLAGEDGPGGIVFDDFESAFLFGNLALAVILLDGGLRTQLSTFRVALKPALSLATLGVLVTAAITGLAATALLDIDWRYGLLLGAIVASTDAAAVFALLRASATRLNERVAATLEIESGVNDPMAVFLTLGMIEFIRSGARYPGADMLWALLQQFALGAAGGLAFGFALSALARRIRLIEGLNAIFIAAGGVLAFAACNALGGSGFLAVYLSGLVVGNRALPVGDHVLRAMDGLAWLAQSGMFLMLGLLVTPSTALALAWPALLVSLLLIVVARPLAVWISLAPFRLPWREIGYLSWVGLRGAVPIVLAVYPTMAGIPGARMFFDAAFFVVLVSLLLQGSTVGFAARGLRVGVPPAAEPGLRVPVGADAGEPVELVEVEIGADSRLVGAPADALALPVRTSAVSVARGGRLLRAGEAGALAAHDKLLLLSPSSQVAMLLGLFAPRPEQGPFEEHAFFGEFVLDAAARVADVEETYGVQLANDDERSLTVAALLSRRLHGRPVLGDRIQLGALGLTVRAMQGAAITSVGLKLLRSAN